MLQSHRYISALLLVASVGLATPACASQIYGARGGYSQPFDRRAYENGRGEGLKRGRADARARRAFSFARYGEYREADKGYKRRDGNRELYRRTFRQGFQDGYAQAYNEIARQRRDEDRSRGAQGFPRPGRR
jgi:hypothetical protein